MPQTVTHATVFVSGHVQGVGFRYTAMQVAKEFDVSGFVSNLSDGRVHLEAEGRQSEVAAFIEAVLESMHGFVKNTERTSAARHPQFIGFEIR
jgi:acylphosphatase